MAELIGQYFVATAEWLWPQKILRNGRKDRKKVRHDAEPVHPEVSVKVHPTPPERGSRRGGIRRNSLATCATENRSITAIHSLPSWLGGQANGNDRRMAAAAFVCPPPFACQNHSSVRSVAWKRLDSAAHVGTFEPRRRHKPPRVWKPVWKPAVRTDNFGTHRFF